MATTWKTYFGEAPEAHSSDDDDYHEGKPNGYTRDEARERDRKWAEIKAFEAARTITVLTKADHRGLCRSVRPVDGAEAVVSYDVRDKGDTLLKQAKRQVVTVGANDAQLDDVLRELRRGERARITLNDGSTMDVTLHFVRAERAIAPRPSPWAPLIQGACRSKRVALGASSQRPRWGDTATVRIGADEASLGASQRVVLGGAHDLGEGVEAALLGMKTGEACVVVASGEFGEGRCCVALDDIEESAPAPDVDGARRVAAQGRARGLGFAQRNEWRRAEAMFSRALGALEENLDLLKIEDRRDIESEVVAPLLLDIAACARRRRGYSDEDVCLTKALGLAVERAGGAARARALLRRGAARADLERFVEARDDLKRAAQDARMIVTDSNASTEARKDMRDAYEACRTELERLVRQRKEQKAREKTGLFGGLDRAFSDVVEVTDDKPPKPPPLLYEREIDATLRKKQPWNHDPRYYDLPRAVHTAPPPAEKIRTDDLKGEFNEIDEAETEQAKLSSMLRQNVVMQQMYDCNGTGRRGKPSNDPEYMGGGMVA
jgi:tetratricopeptide (TPR) repeat protein